MRKAIAMALAFTCLVVPAAAMADAVKEVADVGPARLKAFMQGDADGWTIDMADNATFQSQYSPFRIDGRPAIRAGKASTSFARRAQTTRSTSQPTP